CDAGQPVSPESHY
ncbi:unnamed protein product, partial [Rotaria sp. Silwood2]